MTAGVPEVPRRTAAKAGAIKVLVVEGEPVVRRRLCAAVNAAAALVLSGSARTIAQARALVDRVAPDVVLADLGLPDGSGLEVVRYAKAMDPARQAIVVAPVGDDEHLIESIRAGATGYLLKDALPEDIASAIVQVREGGSPMSPAIARRVLQGFNAPPQRASTDVAVSSDASALSEREVEVLRLVAKGLSFKEIGTALHISSHTVITHIKRTYRKLGVHSRGEAVYEASQLGLL